MFIIFILFFCFFYCLSSNINDDEFLFVYEHCRHGRRSPSATNRFGDIYNITWNFSCEITNNGRIQHYFLGLRNKYRYQNFINFSNYNPEEIKTCQTGSPRTFESLFYQLFGMYSDDKTILESANKYFSLDNKTFTYGMPPNINNWKNKKEFKSFYNEILEYLNKNKSFKLDLSSYNKTLFNIETINPTEEYSLMGGCRNLNLYLKKFNTSSILNEIERNFTQKYEKQLKIMMEKEGKTYFDSYAWNLADQFICAYENGKEELKYFSEITNISLPEYYKDSLEIIYYDLYNVQCYSKSCILFASRKMYQLLQYFDSKIKNNYSSPKILIETGHDYTMNHFQVLMNRIFGYKTDNCVFGSNIFFEFYRKKGHNNKYMIRYYENDGPVLEVEYSEFKTKLIKSLWSNDDIDKFCNGDESYLFEIHKETDDNLKQNTYWKIDEF